MNILIVAITRLGDLLQASPTIVGFKNEHPDAQITVLVDKDFATVCNGIPGIDEVYMVDMSMMCRCIHREGDGIVDAFEYVKNLIEDLQSRNFDSVLNMSSAAYTALLLKMIGAPESRGWVSDDEGHRLISNPWAMLFAAFVYHSNRDYNSLNLVDIFRCSAGVSAHPKRLMYEVPKEAKGFAQQFLKGFSVSDHSSLAEGPLVCIQAGASQEKRQWPPSCFAEVAKQLITETNARVVLIGSRSEAAISEAILECYRHPHFISAAGKTGLGELADLLSEAEVLITGDTGPMHLAIAVGTPVVALFLASAYCFETGPYSEGNIVIQPQISCNPCNPNLSCSRPDCHEQISADLVVHLTKLILETPQQEVKDLQITSSIADPRNVGVYATTFDEDNFLDFKLLNTASITSPRTNIYYRAARQAYRYLWKHELGVLKRNLDERTAKAVPLQAGSATAEHLVGLRKILQLTDHGTFLLDQLTQLIEDQQSPAYLLGETNTALQKNDRNLEEIGLTAPVYGALIRMFVMEKENMRGDNPLFLASEMKDRYQTLAYRAKRLDQLFDENSNSSIP